MGVIPNLSAAEVPLVKGLGEEPEQSPDSLLVDLFLPLPLLSLL